MRVSVQKTYFETVNSNLNRYKGIPMLCAKDLHEQIGERVNQYLSPGQRVLDLGCGRGALSLRLRDAGLRVDSVDVFDLCMCKEQATFWCMDIEEYLKSTSQTYDAIFLVEVLEHLENPYAVLRQCYRRLGHAGLLFISTPNVDSDFSRTWFFLKGRHWYFEKHNTENDGHISPLHRFQLDYIISELNMTLEDEFAIPGDVSLGSWRFKLLLWLLQIYGRAKRYERKDGLVRGVIVRK